MVTLYSILLNHNSVTQLNNLFFFGKICDGIVLVKGYYRKQLFITRIFDTSTLPVFNKKDFGHPQFIASLNSSNSLWKSVLFAMEQSSEKHLSIIMCVLDVVPVLKFVFTHCFNYLLFLFHSRNVLVQHILQIFQLGKDNYLAKLITLNSRTDLQMRYFFIC